MVLEEYHWLLIKHFKLQVVEERRGEGGEGEEREAEYCNSIRS